MINGHNVEVKRVKMHYLAHHFNSIFILFFLIMKFDIFLQGKSKWTKPNTENVVFDNSSFHFRSFSFISSQMLWFELSNFLLNFVVFLGRIIFYFLDEILKIDRKKCDKLSPWTRNGRETEPNRIKYKSFFCFSLVRVIFGIDLYFICLLHKYSVACRTQ